MNPDDFLVVIRDSDKRLFRHVTVHDAKSEAERLAMKHPGSRFYVLMSHYSVLTAPIVLDPDGNPARTEGPVPEECAPAPQETTNG